MKKDFSEEEKCRLSDASIQMQTSEHLFSLHVISWRCLIRMLNKGERDGVSNKIELLPVMRMYVFARFPNNFFSSLLIDLMRTYIYICMFCKNLENSSSRCSSLSCLFHNAFACIRSVGYFLL